MTKSCHNLTKFVLMLLFLFFSSNLLHAAAAAGGPVVVAVAVAGAGGPKVDDDLDELSLAFTEQLALYTQLPPVLQQLICGYLLGVSLINIDNDFDVLALDFEANLHVSNLPLLPENIKQLIIRGYLFNPREMQDAATYTFMRSSPIRPRCRTIGELGGDVTAMAMVDSNTIIVGTNFGILIKFNVRTNVATVLNFSSHSGPICALTMLDECHLAVSVKEGLVIVDQSDAKLVFSTPVSHDGAACPERRYITAFAISRGCSIFFTGCADGTVISWNWDQKNKKAMRKFVFSDNDAALSVEGLFCDYTNLYAIYQGFPLRCKRFYLKPSGELQLLEGLRQCDLYRFLKLNDTVLVHRRLDDRPCVLAKEGGVPFEYLASPFEHFGSPRLGIAIPSLDRIPEPGCPFPDDFKGSFVTARALDDDRVVVLDHGAVKFINLFTRTWTPAQRQLIIRILMRGAHALNADKNDLVLTAEESTLPAEIRRVILTYLIKEYSAHFSFYRAR